MGTDIEVIKHMYKRFNDRDIDSVLGVLNEDVVWANGMDGGYVHGREGVREYWIRQWSVVSPRLQPVSFGRNLDGSMVVEAVQSIRDLEGRSLQNQTHGLVVKTVVHVFHIDQGKVARFDIR